MNREKISYFASGFLALGLVPLTAVIVPLYALGIGASPAEVGIIMAMRSLLPFLLAIRAELWSTATACVLLSRGWRLLVRSFPWCIRLRPACSIWFCFSLFFGVCQSFCWIGVQTGIGKTYRGDPVVTSHLGFWRWAGHSSGRSLSASSGIIWGLTRALSLLPCGAVS